MAFLSPIFLNNSTLCLIGAFAILVKAPVKGANSRVFSPNNLAWPVPVLFIFSLLSTTIKALKVKA